MQYERDIEANEVSIDDEPNGEPVHPDETSPESLSPKSQGPSLFRRLPEFLLVCAGAGLATHALLQQDVWAGLSAPLAIGGAGVALVALLALVISGRPPFVVRHGKSGVAETRTRLERNVELLGELQERVRESEIRVEPVEETEDDDTERKPGDAIIRRKRGGRVSFVNDAFCQIFGVDREAVLGREFIVPRAGGEAPFTTELDDTACHTGRYLQHVETVDGARWFAWEDFAVGPGADGLHEIESVGRDVTHQRENQMALQDARDRAEDANRAKSRFLASMSHEIRTPMNGILGMTGLLMETELSPEQKTYSRAIETSATTLLTLIDEILDFSKIEAGKLELKKAPFKLADTVQGVAELLAPRARDKGLEIGWYADPDLPASVTGDEIRLRQILMNLLGNAIKFTETGGVSLAVERAPGGSPFDVRFLVRDTGIGLTVRERECIFDEFEQADSSPARRHGGTGLGLAICKRLVDAMEGRIWVDCAEPPGSTFGVRISFEPGETKDNVGNAWPRLSQSMRVLLVSEKGVEAGLIARQLEAAGAEVTLARPEEATIHLWSAAERAEPFNVVMMPSGRAETCENIIIQAREACAALGGLRAIALVEPSERDCFEDLKALGFDAHLVRPVRPVSLISHLLGETQEDEELTDVDAGVDSAHPENFPACRVLLAEDNGINALLANTMLDRMGCAVVHVMNGKQALAAATATRDEEGAEPFDLILMDIHMPEMDGLEAAAAIQALYSDEDGEGAAPPIVALTADAFSEERQRYLDAGLDDYLAKPFRREELEALLAKWTGAGATETVDTPLASSA